MSPHHPACLSAGPVTRGDALVVRADTGRSDIGNVRRERRLDIAARYLRSLPPAQSGRFAADTSQDFIGRRNLQERLLPDVPLALQGAVNRGAPLDCRLHDKFGHEGCRSMNSGATQIE